MEEKTRKPETAKQTAKEHHVPEHEDEHQHGNPQFALKVRRKRLAFALHRRHDRATLNVLSP